MSVRIQLPPSLVPDVSTLSCDWGHEALVRRWSSTRLSELIDQLRRPSPQLLDQLHVPA